MYYLLVYLSIVLLLFISLLLIAISKLDNHALLRKIRNYLTIGLVISTLLSFTPKSAKDSAPFHKYGKAKVAFFGCNFQIMTTARFCDLSTEEFEWCYCHNGNAFATILHCYDYGHPEQMNSLLGMCRYEYNITISEEDLERSREYYASHAKSIDEIPDYSPVKIVDFPVKLDESRIEIFTGSYELFLGNYDRSVEYGNYLVLYWAIIFALVAIGNWSKFILPGFHTRLTDPVTNWVRKNITLPATWNKNKTTEVPFATVLDMLVPTRQESLILTSFLGLSLYFMINDIHYFKNDILFPTKASAMLRYYAVRSGMLASLMMPLLVLFAGRNNILQTITRWDYSTFITLHRWLSRIVFFMVVVHGVLYSLYFDPYLEKIKEAFIVWGIIATIAGGFIMIQGLLVLRRKWYEMFLFIHIVLALVFILGAWVHVKDLFCVWFYYFTAMVWLFDRIIRIGSIWTFGFPEAKVYLIADEALKVVVPKPEYWEAIPGGHAFIYFLKPGCFWQSHPFTYTISPTNDEINLFIKVKGGITKSLYHDLCTRKDRYAKIRVAIEGSYGEQTPASRYDNAVFIAGGNGIPGIFAEANDLITRSHRSKLVKLIWIIKEYKSLCWFYEELLSLKHKNIDVTVYVTRPHTPAIPSHFEMAHFCHSTNSAPRFRHSRTLEGRREEEHAYFSSVSILGSEVLEEDKHIHTYDDPLGPLMSLSKKILGYNATSEYSPDIVLVMHGDAPSLSLEFLQPEQFTQLINHIRKDLSHINIREERPNVELLVKSNIKESPGSTCFVTCGHPAMVDEIRALVVNNIDNNEKKRVDYFEQLQVWA